MLFTPATLVGPSQSAFLYYPGTLRQPDTHQRYVPTIYFRPSATGTRTDSIVIKDNAGAAGTSLAAGANCVTARGRRSLMAIRDLA